MGYKGQRWAKPMIRQLTRTCFTEEHKTVYSRCVGQRDGSENEHIVRKAL